MGRLQRLIRHLFAPSSRRRFPADSLQRITRAIADGERRHRGEICFAVESALAPGLVWRGVDARAEALDVFARLRVWDTAANNGVLLYLLLADHRIEIVADRGFDGRVSEEQWRGVCQLIENRLRAGEPEAAVVAGIEALSDMVARHFPREDGDIDANELPDDPHLL
ncbi:TPM domain-containing protein [Marilutibacter chinensis]|uniref:TPM domain-containing protein n=1 Tax=Marilutibacter chinensis TaxID=2912247 RepID=A0ABS9HU87_9GAMM|nr:TPM domain-containing protein [Lysobacter chinensis]MCF7221937.1 TPM domain-containing protein [Lysobacter chinensis]